MNINAIPLSMEEIDNILLIYPGEYPNEMKQRFYGYDEIQQRYVCVDNSTGNCYTEIFSNLISVYLYFEDDHFSLEELNELELLSLEENEVKSQFKVLNKGASKAWKKKEKHVKKLLKK